MSLSDCAALVERGDPDRWRTLAAASPEQRAILLPIYALNLEIARAAWASADPLVAEMRLQWWRDALAERAAGAPPRAHPVLEAAVFLDGKPEAGEVLDRLIEARRWDIWRDPFADDAALLRHLDATAGGVMWLAARALGAPARAERVVRAAGTASGLAGWFAAVPALRARGRHPLPDPTHEGIAALARRGLGLLRSARRHRRDVPAAALPALMPVCETGAILRRCVRDPRGVDEGRLARAEIARRWSFLVCAVTGRW
ncbi:MAG: squalene/phytoene synthase family protein [Gemmobacter sp.]